MFVVHNLLRFESVHIWRVDVTYNDVRHFPKNLTKAGKDLLVCFRGRHIHHSEVPTPYFYRLLGQKNDSGFILELLLEQEWRDEAEVLSGKGSDGD
jgi:hypothetical protein